MLMMFPYLLSVNDAAHTFFCGHTFVGFFKLQGCEVGGVLLLADEALGFGFLRRCGAGCKYGKHDCSDWGFHFILRQQAFCRSF